MKFVEIEIVETNDTWDMQKTHSHDHYELYYLISGTRTHIVDNNIYNIGENTIMLIPPKVSHRTEGGEFKRVVINFNLEYMDILDKNFIHNIFDTTAVLCDPKHKTEMIKLFNLLYNEYTHTYQRSDDYLKIKIAELLILINRRIMLKNSFISSSTTKNSMINKTINLIEHNYKTLTLDSIAKQIFVSKEHLSREFKKCTGLTVAEYINNKKISEAIYKLINTNKSIDEIAYCCGFSSSNYFSYVFKSAMGLSPLQYRKIKSNPKSLTSKKL